MSAAIALVVAPLGLSAQAACAFSGSSSERAWPAPMDQIVTLRSQTLPLREAIDALVRGTGLRITYSSDLLPARSVCASVSSQRVGAVLSGWLSGSRLEPVAVGSQLIVLAPSRRDVSAAGVGDLSIQPLEVVSVQGSAERGVDVAVDVYARDVIHRSALPRIPGATLAQVLSASVPGVWSWSPSGQGVQSGGLSLRGASSFGVSSPKVYIDGIEVANPLIASQLNADVIEEIEVIRGPQGAALYGSDAINGVINVTTRHDGAVQGGHEFLLTSNAGAISSDYASAGVLQRDHGFSYRAGSAGNTIGLGMAMSSTGAFVPGEASQRLLGNAGVSLLRGHTLMQFTARGYSHRAGIAPNPVFQNLQSLSGAGTATPSAVSAASRGQSVSEYTLGTQIRSGAGKWLHTFVAGIDGYRLDNATLPGMPVRTPADSAVQAASGASDRLTIRLSTTGHVMRESGTGPTARITLGVEQSVLRDATFASIGQSNSAVTAWRNTTGVLANGNVAVGRGLTVSGGVRLEHNNGYTSFDDISVLPTIGSAWNRSFGATEVTLRGSYGRAIRPPRVSAGVLNGPAQWDDLGPEVQSGVEFGADLMVASRYMLRITHFDQVASGLVQPVPAASVFGGTRSSLYDLQNVGAIRNVGVELQGSADLGRLQLNAGLSLVDSKVQRVAAGYRGDMREGDRALQVPRQTLGLGALWTAQKWGASVGLSRAANWVNYDWLAIAESEAIHGSGITRQPSRLRAFRRDYPGVTRLRASFSRDLTSGISLLFSGENLLGIQRGEPDNVTIVPGRTFSAGFRAGF